MPAFGLYPLHVLGLIVVATLVQFVVVIWPNKDDGDHVQQVAQAFAVLLGAIWPWRRTP